MKRTEEKEPPFVKLYYNDVQKLYELTNLEMAIAIELTKLIQPYQKEYSNLVVINSSTKDAIAEAVGLNGFHKTGIPKKYDVSKYIRNLVKKDVLICLKKGYYIVDSLLFSKVDWRKTSQMRKIQLNITYDIVGKSMVTLIENSEEVENEQKSIFTML